MSHLLAIGKSFVLPTMLLFLNLADSVTTRYGLSRGLVEANPLFFYAEIPVKFLGCGALFITPLLQDRLTPRAKVVNSIILKTMIIIYIFVVLNNIVKIIGIS